MRLTLTVLMLLCAGCGGNQLAQLEKECTDGIADLTATAKHHIQQAPINTLDSLATEFANDPPSKQYSAAHLAELFRRMSVNLKAQQTEPEAAK